MYKNVDPTVTILYANPLGTPLMPAIVRSRTAKALSEYPVDKARNCCFELQKAFPSDNPQHAELLAEAKASRARLVPNGAALEPTQVHCQPGRVARTPL